ncbi:hypothetical protein MTP99_015898 [Tenebrio molitor]|nr:hypothetical protein MTP99_015898 [Tenebrio molitor]
MLSVKENIDISRFHQVSAFLKQQSVGHRPKKSKVFTLEEMERFLDTASDDEYLLLKVVLIVGVFGGCRIGELVSMLVDHVDDRGSVIVVEIPDTKTHKPRSRLYLNVTLIDCVNNTFLCINHGCSTKAPRTTPFEALPSPARIHSLGPYHHYQLRAVGACWTISSQAIKGMRAWTIIHYNHYCSLNHPSSLKSLTLYLVNFVYLNRNGSPFWERPSIFPKEKRGTCLAEVRGVDAGSVYPRCNEKREPAKRAGRGGPLWSQGPCMTCDLGRRVSRPPWWKASVSSFVTLAVGIRRTQVLGTAPITSYVSQGLGGPAITRVEIRRLGGED